MGLRSHRATGQLVLPSLAVVVASLGAPANWQEALAQSSSRIQGAGLRLPSPTSPATPAKPGEHPLVPAIRFARDRYDYLCHNVRDFTCILVKRERIDGHLRGYEFIRTRVRLRQLDGDRVVAPFSVYMEYLSPTKYQGRKVLFTEGKNDGRMLVRNGGSRFSYVIVRVAPDSDSAKRESRYPITELGLENVARRLIEKAEEDLRCDPEGTNTQVTFFRDARVDGRPCTRIRVVHPRPDEKLSFHIANVFVDDELNVPIRVEGYDWPVDSASGPVLLEEYTYTRLRLNVGLTDADFATSLLAN